MLREVDGLLAEDAARAVPHRVERIRVAVSPLRNDGDEQLPRPDDAGVESERVKDGWSYGAVDCAGGGLEEIGEVNHKPGL